MDEETRRLVPLGEARGFRVAAGMPDVRGWDVVGADGAVLGRVVDLLVDTAAGRVRYVEVETVQPSDGGRRIHVPVGLARLDESRDAVLVPTVTTAVASSLVTHEGGVLTRDYEMQVRRRILGAETLEDDVDDAALAADAGAGALGGDERFYRGEAYDERRFAAARRRADRGEDAERRDDDDDDDFGYLAGVGGAMTDDDRDPEVVGELDAGQISIPVMEEDSERRLAPEDRRGSVDDAEAGLR